jgi:hypothetical protein
MTKPKLPVDRVVLQGRCALCGVANLLAGANRRGLLKFTYARKIYLGSDFFLHPSKRTSASAGGPAPTAPPF